MHIEIHKYASWLLHSTLKIQIPVSMELKKKKQQKIRYAIILVVEFHICTSSGLLVFWSL